MARDVLFARARDAIVTTAPDDRLAVRDMAASLGGGMVLDAVADSRDPATRGHDRVANRRLVLDAAGITGQGAAQPAPAITITANQMVLAMGSLTGQQLRDLAGLGSAKAQAQEP